MSPKEVTFISPVDSEPTFQSPSGAMAQAPVQAPATLPQVIASTSSSPPPASYVTAEQFSAISDKWAEQFARMEALLSRGNVFSTPVSSVKPVDSQALVSDKPFLAPVTRPAGLAGDPLTLEASSKTKETDYKSKKKAHKSRRDKSSDKLDKSDTKVSTERSLEKKSSVTEVRQKKRDWSGSPVTKSSRKQEISAFPSGTCQLWIGVCQATGYKKRGSSWPAFLGSC